MKTLDNNSIFYNGYLSTDLKLFFKDKPSIEKLNEDYDTEEIEGRNGSLYINKGTYRDRKLSHRHHTERT